MTVHPGSRCICTLRSVCFVRWQPGGIVQAPTDLNGSFESKSFCTPIAYLFSHITFRCPPFLRSLPRFNNGVLSCALAHLALVEAQPVRSKLHQACVVRLTRQIRSLVHARRFYIWWWWW